MSSFRLTRHAVDRFIQRMRPNASVRDAFLELLKATNRALPLERRTRYGQKIWRIDNPAMRLITKHDEGSTIVVTILDGHEGGEDEAEEAVLEAYRRLRSVPDAGTEEAMSSAPETASDFRAWCHIELKRLDVEQKRLNTVNRSLTLLECQLLLESKKVNKEEAERLRALALDREKERTARHQMDVRVTIDKGIRWRNGLLRKAAKRLRDIDAEGSAELLAEIERTVVKDKSDDG